jgi:lipoprotein-releasing system permease protein
MALPYELGLALRYLRFHRGKTFISLITFISVAGVTVGTAALVIATALMNGFERDFRERILSGAAHVQILGPGGIAPEETALLVEAISGTEGVRTVTPVLFTPSLVATEISQPEYVELYAVEAESHGEVIDADERLMGAFARLGAGTESGLPGIVLGSGVSENVGAVPGDVVRVVVPRLRLTPFGANPRSQGFEVVDTFHSDHFEADQMRAYIRLEDGRRLLRAEEGASWIEVRLHDLGELQVVKERLREALDYTWSVVDLIEANEGLLKALNQEKVYLVLAIWLIVVVAALNIASTLVLMVADKVREIGTLTALGARPREIARIFLLQGLVIGLAGTVLGLTAGWALAAWLDRAQILSLNPEVYYLSHVRFVTEGLDLVRVALLAMGTALVATLYPAWRASTLDPVEAIRYE